MKSVSRAGSIRAAAVAVAMVGGLSGCQHAAQGNLTADYPIAEQFPQIYQSKLMAAAHWQLIADNEAQLLTERFESLPELSYASLQGPKQAPSGQQSGRSGGHTSFAQAYENFLLAGLVDRGVMLFEHDRGMPVEYDVQVVKFADRTQSNLPPGAVSATAFSAYLIAHAASHWNNPAALLIPLAVGADAYNFFNADTGTPDTEIILTTRVKNAGQLVYTHSSVYYLRTEDQRLYDANSGFAVRGPTTL